MDDPTWKVPSMAMKNYGINDPQESYGLWIEHGSHSEFKRLLGRHEKPLLLSKQLYQEGMKPIFMLRKIAQVNIADH
jgi:hypothetical protein